MMFRSTVICFLVFVIGIEIKIPSYAMAKSSAEYVEVEARKGVAQPFLLLEPSNPPTAAVILFPGGAGRINVKKNGKIRSGGNNFLVRTRRMFANLGFAVAVIDVPSDRRNFYRFRKTAAHAKDVNAVITYLRKKYDVPIWLVGTSRGTISAANGAARLKQGIRGIVLTSSLFGGRKKDNLNHVALRKITLPTLFVHHKDDKCRVTPAKLVGTFMKKMRNVSVKQMKLFSGGDPSRQKNPCKALTKHGFIGIEHDVVKFISKWIVSH